MTTTCPKVGRIVPASILQHAIYVNGQWIARCPNCKRSAPFAMAELRPDRMGYRRRWLDHS